MSDERIQQIEQGLAKPYDCGVCLGLSPSWDGHDESCRGRVWESVPWLIGELRDARAENERLTALIAVMDDDADQALIDKAEAVEAESQAGDRIAAERDDLRAKLAAAERQLAAGRDALAECDAYDVFTAKAIRVALSSEGGTE